MPACLISPLSLRIATHLFQGQACECLQRLHVNLMYHHDLLVFLHKIQTPVKGASRPPGYGHLWPVDITWRNSVSKLRRERCCSRSLSSVHRIAAAGSCRG